MNKILVHCGLNGKVTHIAINGKTLCGVEFKSTRRGYNTRGSNKSSLSFSQSTESDCPTCKAKMEKLNS